ncbi:large subunit GTPase 1 [Entomortierella parvispora]|uniref:Large subunit GTPase 1 n=1 Tax=Entomortierella parvispora TaxID=205924 RepID=A0A9P3LZG9_9FUNG|nr:large subunit GTPase 1 [Entomortierella parvispora]
MAIPKSKKNVGLGQAIIKARFKGRSRPRDGDERLHSAEVDDGASWTRLQSVTQEGDLESFLSTAELAGTEFTAEKLNIKVISNQYENPFMLSADKEEETLKKHKEFKNELTVPRRPHWDENTTGPELQRMERTSFLDWRRGLATLAERESLLLTPFERNLEVWRQLWRVIERSHLIVQIVDARNPLFFRSTDLETYVTEVDPRKKNLLLINKADYLTVKQRKRWADYFDSEGIRYTFFSAALAKERQEKEQAEKERLEALAQELAEMKAANSDYTEDEEEEEEEEEEEFELVKEAVKEEEAAEKSEPKEASASTSSATKNVADNTAEDSEEEESEEESEDEDEEVKANKTHSHWKSIKETEKDDERTRIRDTKELYELLVKETPIIDDPRNPLNGIMSIGLVGYPNVGKSSTINALLGEHAVSVSATPGKTKHFQTIHLTPKMILCDCPGLVFPSFATTQGDMVCNGVLPIDQLREFTGSVGLVAQRIPKEVLEAIYGIKIAVLSEEEGGTGMPTAEEFLIAYAVARGFTKAGQGNPDESRAARYILKDYVNGKLLYCAPPPSEDSLEFNKEHNQLDRFTKRKAAPTHRLPASASTFIDMNAITPLTHTGSGTGKTAAVDSSFFRPQRNLSYLPKVTGKMAIDISEGMQRVQMFPHQQRTDNQGGYVSRRMRMQGVRDGLLDMGVENVAGALGNKKHKKGKKNIKQRSGGGLF